MAKEERIGNTRKKLWQEGNESRKTKEAIFHRICRVINVRILKIYSSIMGFILWHNCYIWHMSLFIKSLQKSLQGSLQNI